jgi:hypothetical protein
MREELDNYTYGSETKRKRQLLKLYKDHHNDAFSILLTPNKYFEKVEDRIVVKDGVKFNKIEQPLEIIQQSNRSRDRRSLSTFYDAKYIDSRDGSEKSGQDLSKENRKFRLKKIRKGESRKRDGKSKFEMGSIIKFNDSGNIIIAKCGGMSNLNVLVDNFRLKQIGFKKYGAIVLCNRNGLIKKNIKKI